MSYCFRFPTFPATPLHNQIQIQDRLSEPALFAPAQLLVTIPPSTMARYGPTLLLKEAEGTPETPDTYVPAFSITQHAHALLTAYGHGRSASDHRAKYSVKAWFHGHTTLPNFLNAIYPEWSTKDPLTDLMFNLRTDFRRIPLDLRGQITQCVILYVQLLHSIYTLADAVSSSSLETHQHQGRFFEGLLYAQVLEDGNTFTVRFVTSGLHSSEHIHLPTVVATHPRWAPEIRRWQQSDIRFAPPSGNPSYDNTTYQQF